MANELLGSGAKILINGYAYDVIEGGVSEKRNLIRADTTATGRNEINLVDKQAVTVNLKALRYSTINPHAANLYIAAAGVTNDSSNVIYYPNGDNAPGGVSADVTKSWRMPKIYWESYEENFRAQEGLITLSVSGKSSDVYKRPGEA